jgi:chromosome segregation and condensation protein ScpB
VTRALTAEAQETFETVQQLQPMTRAQLMDWLGVKADAAARRLQKLQARGLIVSVGVGRGAAWKVAPAKAEEKG